MKQNYSKNELLASDLKKIREFKIETDNFKNQIQSPLKSETKSDSKA